MTLHILSKQDTVLNKFIAQIRDKSVQKDSMRFRRNLERIGEITAYEISKELAYSPRVVETPLGEAEVGLIDDQVVVATILRAGLPYHQGFLNYFDDAENAFVSAYRKSTKDGKFTVKVEYISCGDLEGKVLLLVDPMLATGSSLVLAYKALCEGRYTQIYARCGCDCQRTGDRLRAEEYAAQNHHGLGGRRRRGVDLALLYRPGYRRCR